MKNLESIIPVNDTLTSEMEKICGGNTPVADEPVVYCNSDGVVNGAQCTSNLEVPIF